ncbi:BON domain-containing protein [Flavobacterium sp.]|uniref:BON domain-containing protein n=1 Tax=Flavobacterium sp. TaxID=239 RepID=UPI00262B1A73|nr:BON domain-containing protein [Flavobacterium sp.]
MSEDTILKEKVIDELKCRLLHIANKINVSDFNGRITLTGNVNERADKSEAETIARSMAGVTSVVNEIDVTANPWEEKRDIEIAAELINVFRWNWNTLNDNIAATVVNGWVTLSGELEWNYQKEAAKVAAGNLIGVKGVTNNITIRTANDVEVHRETIERALKSHAEVDVEHIAVTVSGHDLTLSGSVDSLYQKELAGRIAWKAPGVIHVNNELIVDE